MKERATVHTYRMHKLQRILLISLFAMALVLLLVTRFLLSNMNDDFELVSRVFDLSFLGTLLPLAYVVLKFSRPMYQIAPDYLSIMGKKHRWDTLDRAEMNAMNVFGRKNRIVSMTRKKRGLLSLFPLKVALSQVENSDDLFMRLRQRFPDLEYGEGAHMLRQEELAGRIRYPKPSVNVRYREFIFTPSGIQVDSRQIPWEKVVRAEGQKDVIAGYGKTTLSYHDDDRIITRTIKPERSRTYHAAVLYVLHYANAARLDSGLVDMIDYPPADALVDKICLGMILSGVILAIPAMGMVLKYMVKSDYDLLPSAALFGPMLLAIIASLILMARKKRVRVPAFVAVPLSMSAPALAIGCVVVLFSTSPAVMPLIAADLYGLSGNEAAVERSYEKALAAGPENLEAQYAAGHYYYVNEKYEKALPHMLKAYEADKDYWNISFMEDISTAYGKLGRNSEGIEWCDRVIRDHEDKGRIVSRMEKMKESLSGNTI